MVIRKRYIHILQSVKNTDFIKILTGMRRSGKSTILLQFIEILKKENPKGKFIYINFDDKLNNNLKDSKALENYIDNFIKKNAGKKIFLFLDEIQDVGGFDVLILGYFQNKNINIFLTGSNSKLLSSQLSSKFTGRDLQINVLPFSFAEFCEYYPEESDLTALFQRYRKVGGLPNFFSIKDENLLEHSANNLIETILIKDLLPFYKIKNVMLLKKILTFAYENIGCEFSSENIKTYLKNNPPYSNIAAKTIDSYLSYLCDAYLIYKVQRIDLKGMNILKTLYSCYATDLLLRNSWINKDETYNYGKQLENIVFFELKRRFNKVNIGYASNVSNGERKSLQIDFFCQNRVGKFYFQVCENITNEETLNREINALKKVKDGRKILLNNSGVNKNIDEIEIIDIKKWLLDIP